MGYLLAIGAGLFFSISQMWAQRGMRQASAAAGVTVALFFNNITYLVLLGWEFGGRGFPFLKLEGVLYAVGGGLMGNIIGRTLNYSAIRRIGSARTISLTLTQALFAFLYSVFLLGEVPGLWSFTGIALVLGGVFWISREQVKRQPSIASVLAVDSRGDSIGGGTCRGELADKIGLAGVIFALLAGLAYSLADLSRKLSMRILPSAIVSSAIGGFCALVVQTATFAGRGGWQEIRSLSRESLRFLVLGGLSGGLANVLLNAALSYSSLVVVNSLYNIRVVVPIVLGPLILGAEAKINKIVVYSTALVLGGTWLIITR